MAILNFKVIGVDDVTTDPTVRFVCSTSDDSAIYIGSESTNSDGHIWKYLNGKWSRITGNLEGQGFKSINSILYRKGSLFVGTGQDVTEFFNGPAGKGRVFVNNGKSWQDTQLNNSDLSVPEAYQVLIRNLISIKNDIFAAGAMYKIFKYTDSSWISLKPGVSPFPGGGLDFLTYSWSCFETDGQDLYSAAASLLKSDFSGVIKYDVNASSFESISPAGFGDPSRNTLITNLCYYNSELYAATYNDSEGTQVWKYLGTPGNWTQVNTAGFGNSNNVNTTSLKVVDGNLVAATQNKFGSEVWAYNLIDGWVQQTINSEVLYYSYMIQVVGSNKYLIGRESLKLVPPVSSTEYLTYHEKAFKNANYWPQGPIGTVPLGLDKYRFIAANNKYTLVSEGTLDDPLNDTSLSPITSGYNLLSSLPYPQNINVSLDATSLEIPVDPENSAPGAILEKFNIDLNETDPYAAFPEFIPKFITTDPVKFSQFSGGNTLPPTYTGRYKTYTPYFNALHMALIPKGQHRGKVVVLGKEPIIGYVSSIDPVEAWSFQPWAIIDPSDDAGTPEKPRCLNYLFPIGPSSLFTGPIYIGGFAVTPQDYVWPNLFCVGHTWSPSGDWILGGGSKWGYEYSPDGLSWADNKTFVWNPATTSGSWFTNSSFSALTPQEHYASAGSWLRGPDLQLPRWYPTVMMYPNVTRTSNHAHALIFAGESTANDFPQIQYDSYESLILSSIATSSNPGVGIDSYNGSTVFKGPSDRLNSSRYVTESFGGNVVSTFIWNDSIYFYPRTFILSAGEITFAGFTHRSSYLGSHDSNPGIWTNTLGNVPGVGVHNKLRFYGSAYRIPNVSGSNPDRFVRCGGEDPNRDPVYYEPNTTTTDILDVSSLTAQWKPGPTMIDERADLNTVILPDATVMAIGGFRVVTENLFSRFDEAEVPYTPILSVTKLGDHHGFESLTLLSSVSDTEKVEHYIEHLVEHDHSNPAEHDAGKDDLIYEVIPQESGPNNIVGLRQYHEYPEIIDYNEANPIWVRYDWVSTNSWRDYHSTALLLPDGRIMIGGGEVRHSTFNTRLSATDGIGYDFEILHPRYLRPTQDALDVPPRPTGVGLSGATFNTHPEVDCYDLSHGTQYVLSSNFIRADVTLDKVVFMAPGNVTHHACYSQLYHEVPVVKESATKLRFTVPSGHYILPVGFYMVFAITDKKIPSEALWVRIV